MVLRLTEAIFTLIEEDRFDPPLNYEPMERFRVLERSLPASGDDNELPPVLGLLPLSYRFEHFRHRRHRQPLDRTHSRSLGPLDAQRILCIISTPIALVNNTHSEKT